MLARASFLEYIKKTNYKANCIEQSNFSGSNRIQLKCLISFVASSISAVAEEGPGVDLCVNGHVMGVTPLVPLRRAEQDENLLEHGYKNFLI